MSAYRRPSLGLKRRLESVVRQGDAQGLLRMLQGSTHQEARSAGHLLGHELLVLYPEHYWTLFSTIVPVNTRAYLGTFLRALEQLLAKGMLSLDEEVLAQFAQHATPIDARKVLSALLPLLDTPEAVHSLLRHFTDGSPRQMVAILLGIKTDACAYELFQACKKMEGQTDDLREICVLLMKRNEPLFYNLASMLQSYFDLGPLPGTFSLHLEAYQLSRMDDSFATFVRLLRK